MIGLIIYYPCKDNTLLLLCVWFCLKMHSNVLGVVHHKTQCTKKDFEEIFAEWLRHAKQRRMREEVVPAIIN